MMRGCKAPLGGALDLDPLIDSMAEITNSPGSKELGAADSYIKSYIRVNWFQYQIPDGRKDPLSC